MEGGTKGSERKCDSSASRLSYGQRISREVFGSLHLCVCVCVCEWLSGSVLCCVSRVIYQVCREETEEGGKLGGREERREGGRDKSSSRAGSIGVLSPHLTCTGAEQPLLCLLSECGNERLAPGSSSPHAARGQRTEDAGRRTGPGAF